MSYKKTIKRFLPFLLPLVLIPEYLSDYFKYLMYSGVLGVKRDKEKLIGLIISEYHVVEKGLTMPETRLGFGKENLLSLIRNCSEYIERFGSEDIQLIQAISVILEYREFHRKNNYQLDSNLMTKIASLEFKSKDFFACEQIQISKEEYFKHVQSPFNHFSSSRKSVRNYSGNEISIDSIKKAADLARNTPSSCNRQGSRVYIYSDPTLINQILTIQGGNRGFGHLANKLIVITAELGISHGVYERHQVYVDGGMYAMNLLYSLHLNQIAACPLNCNFSVQKDNKLRKLCKIKDSEVFIMMISCGDVPENFQIALSKRYPVEKILTIS